MTSGLPLAWPLPGWGLPDCLSVAALWDEPTNSTWGLQPIWLPSGSACSVHPLLMGNHPPCNPLEHHRFQVNEVQGCPREGSLWPLPFAPPWAGRCKNVIHILLDNLWMIRLLVCPVVGLGVEFLCQIFIHVSIIWVVGLIVPCPFWPVVLMGIPAVPLWPQIKGLAKYASLPKAEILQPG